MPKINWDSVSREKFLASILEKGRASAATDADVVEFISWKNSNPSAPDGDWFANFGSFKIVGTGSHPDSILGQDMSPW
jgi:hypothetical protein